MYQELLREINDLKRKVEALARLENGSYSDEQARDAIGGALTEGNGIDIAISDGGDTITLALTTLTSEWDIGEDMAIRAERIEARDAEGLLIQDDGGVTGVKIEHGGNVELGGGVRIGSTETLGNPGSPAVRMDVGNLSFAAFWPGIYWNAYYDAAGADTVRYTVSEAAYQIYADYTTNQLRLQRAVVGTAGNAVTFFDAFMVNAADGYAGFGIAPLARVHVLQPTLASVVQRLQSTATNDDPIEDTVQNRVATTDATVTTLHTFTIPASTTYFIEATVVARRTGGASGTAEDGAAYKRWAAIKNVAGTATIIGAVSGLITQEDQAGWDCTIDVTSNTARVRVTGATGNNVSWHMTARVYPIST